MHGTNRMTCLGSGKAFKRCEWADLSGAWNAKYFNV